jgi:hypothetical protein
MGANLGQRGRSVFLGLLLGAVLGAMPASAQDCKAAPDLDRFRLAMDASRMKEGALQARLKTPHTMDYAILLLNQYNELLNCDLGLVDDLETRSNAIQEKRCPGWDEPEKMAETALVIKNLKARMKRHRAQVDTSIATFEKSLKKGESRMVSVTFD